LKSVWRETVTSAKRAREARRGRFHFRRNRGPRNALAPFCAEDSFNFGQRSGIGVSRFIGWHSRKHIRDFVSDLACRLRGTLNFQVLVELCQSLRYSRILQHVRSEPLRESDTRAAKQFGTRVQTAVSTYAPTSRGIAMSALRFKDNHRSCFCIVRSPVYCKDLSLDDYGHDRFLVKVKRKGAPHCKVAKLQLGAASPESVCH